MVGRPLKVLENGKDRPKWAFKKINLVAIQRMILEGVARVKAVVIQGDVIIPQTVLPVGLELRNQI